MSNNNPFALSPVDIRGLNPSRMPDSLGIIGRDHVVPVISPRIGPSQPILSTTSPFRMPSPSAPSLDEINAEVEVGRSERPILPSNGLDRSGDSVRTSEPAESGNCDSSGTINYVICIIFLVIVFFAIGIAIGRVMWSKQTDKQSDQQNQNQNQGSQSNDLNRSTTINANQNIPSSGTGITPNPVTPATGQTVQNQNLPLGQQNGSNQVVPSNKQ